MDPITISALIAGGSSLLGGILGQKSQADLNQQNIQHQLQFAQQGLQWKAADATAAEKKFGINRLAMLGVPGVSFSNLVGDTPMAKGVEGMGQGIARAVAAYKSPEERLLMAEDARLDMERKGLQNDILKAELASKLARTKDAPPAMVSAIPLPPKDHRTDVKVSEPQITPHRVVAGVPLLAHPGYTDAQTEEDRSGDFWQEVTGGVLGFPADVSYSVDRMLRLRGYRSRPYNIPDAVARWAMSKNPYLLRR